MKVINLVIAITSALSLAACAEVETPQQKADKEKTIIVWTDCIKRNVRQVDDGKSDPLTIAIAVQPLCLQEKRDVLTAIEPTLTYDQHIAFERRIDSMNIQDTSLIVLQQRKSMS